MSVPSRNNVSSLARLMNDAYQPDAMPPSFLSYTMKQKEPLPWIEDVFTVSPARNAEAHADANEYPFPRMESVDPLYDPFFSSPVIQQRPVAPKAAHRISHLALKRPAIVEQDAGNTTPPMTPSGLSPLSMISDLPTPSAGSFCHHSPTSGDPLLDNFCDIQADHHLHNEQTLSEKLFKRHGLLSSFQDQYTILCELGTGGFGFVIKARRNADGVDVAVKFIIKQNMPEHALRYDPSYHCGTRPVPTEALMLMKLRHEGIVGFYDLLEDATFFYLIMEYHGSPWSPQQPKQTPPSNKTSPGTFNLPSSSSSSSSLSSTLSTQSPTKLGLPAPPPVIRRSSCDLFECIESRSKFTETEGRHIFAQILCIIRYLHRHEVYHMDIKDENIVIDARLRVKLIDFGSAIQCSPSHEFSRFFGTLAYAAPEILDRKPFHGPTSEIWALGILLTIILNGESLFREPADVMEARYNKTAFASLSPAVRHFLNLCLEFNPAKRATIHDLCAHPWIRRSVDEIEVQHERQRRRTATPSRPQTST